VAFEGKAIRDRDVAAGTLMVKIAERPAFVLFLLFPSAGAPVLSILSLVIACVVAM
jgi:hypothetical protein